MRYDKVKRSSSNDRIYEEFAAEHPARRYLIRFHEIRAEVCGREIDWPNRPKVEQCWDSDLLKRRFCFSSFAYAFISYSLVLDEWFTEEYRSQPSRAEQKSIRDYEMKRVLLDECEVAAKAEDNVAVCRFVDLCRELIGLGLIAIAHRTDASPDELLRRYGQPARESVISLLSGR